MGEVRRSGGSCSASVEPQRRRSANRPARVEQRPERLHGHGVLGLVGLESLGQGERGGKVVQGVGAQGAGPGGEVGRRTRGIGPAEVLEHPGAGGAVAIAIAAARWTRAARYQSENSSCGVSLRTSRSLAASCQCPSSAWASPRRTTRESTRGPSSIRRSRCFTAASHAPAASHPAPAGGASRGPARGMAVNVRGSCCRRAS